MKLSVRDVDPDGSPRRAATHAQLRGRNADSDELLNANEEKLEAVQWPTRSLECARRRPGPSYGDFGATAAVAAPYCCNYALLAARRRAENEVGSRESPASKRLPDLIQCEPPERCCLTRRRACSARSQLDGDRACYNDVRFNLARHCRRCFSAFYETMEVARPGRPRTQRPRPSIASELAESVSVMVLQPANESRVTAELSARTTVRNAHQHFVVY